MARRTSELIKLALHYAIQDREAMVDATHSDDPEHIRAKQLVKEFERYLNKRFGELSQTQADAQAKANGSVTYVSIHDIEETS